MRLRLATSPPWVIGLFAGSFMTVFMTVMRVLMDEPWPEAVIGSAFTGAIFGTLMGPSVSLNSGWLFEGITDVPPEKIQQVVRAASRGPIPQDPKVRAAALTLARRRHDYAMHTRTASVLVMLVMAALTVGAASQYSWRWLPVAGFFLIAAPVVWWHAGHLGRRVGRLSEPVTDELEQRRSAS